MAEGLKNIHTTASYSLVEKEKKGNFWKVHPPGTMEPSVSAHCDDCGSVNSSDSSTGRMIAPVVSPEIIRLAIFSVVSTVSNSTRSREKKRRGIRSRPSGFTAILDPRHLVCHLCPRSRIHECPDDAIATLREELPDKKKGRLTIRATRVESVPAEGWRYFRYYSARSGF